VEKIEVDIR